MANAASYWSLDSQCTMLHWYSTDTYLKKRKKNKKVKKKWKEKEGGGGGQKEDREGIRGERKNKG